MDRVLSSNSRAWDCLRSLPQRGARNPVAAKAVAGQNCSKCSLGGSQHFARQHLRGRISGSGRGGRRLSHIVHAGKDYYQVLGVGRDADKKALKAAYRQLARKWHPDVNKESGAEERFKEISNAYEVLTDDNKKQIYDRYGEEGLKGGAGGMGGAGQYANPFDIFESFFGGGGGGGGFGGQPGRNPRNQPQQGNDERHDMVIDFSQAVFGCRKEVDVSRLEECGTCTGEGVKAGTSKSVCSTCGGSGQMVQPVRTPLGNFQQVIQCPECDGTGERFTPCGTCGGDGRVRKSKRLEVTIPAGVDNGSRLRVRNEGNAGRKGGPPGDLFVFIQVRNNPKLRREGTTIHVDVDISYVDAILGTNVQVPTVDGTVDLKIPAGIQPGTTLLMAKRGVPKLGANTRGDQQVHVQVTIPSRLSGEEKRLVEELREVASASKPKTSWFGSKK